MILAVAAGETMADFLTESPPVDPAATILVVAGLAATALLLQLRSRQHVPGVYWATVVLAGIGATLIADGLPRHLGISTGRAAVALGGALLLTLGTWYVSEQSLAVRDIVTVRRESLYWLAVALVFAVGTDAGDLVSGLLGYGPAVLLFAVLLSLAAAVDRRLGGDAVAFWVVFVLARSLGVALGDALSYPRADGGLELGSFDTSVAFLGATLGLVLFLRPAPGNRSSP